MQITTFAEIADEFVTSAHNQVWCSVATINTAARPRLRVLHPIWENKIDTAVGWIAAERSNLKARQLTHNPYVSLVYMKDPIKPVYIDCRCEWVDDPSEKQRVWDLFTSTRPPLGYDIAAFFISLDNPIYGVLKLLPYRIELANLFGQPRVWRR